VLPRLEPVDLVLTDPPYGIGRDCFDDSLPNAIEGINLSNGGKLIAFCSPRLIVDFVNGCNQWVFRRVLWWHKVADLSFPWRGWYMNSEAICVFDKNGAKWPKRCQYHSDVYESGPLEHRPSHPCWKPVDVTASLIDHGLNGGDILDPFMGSGTTLVAAKQLGRRAIGIEIEEKYCEIAVERLRQGVLPLERAQ
jgi:site-specific DNA-methyltransferase (adenine-specific)